MFRVARGVGRLCSRRDWLRAFAAGALTALEACAHRQEPAGVRGPTCYIPGIWPVEHASRHVGSPFGPREDPRRFHNKTRFHNGIDIAVPRGTAVYATADGTVGFAGRGGDHFGRKVVIDHGNGLQTVYAHLSGIKTKEGRHVLRGEVIGKVGSSGRATGPHLHYEVRLNGKPVNPAAYLPE